MSNEIEDYFMRALRLQALVHAGKFLCRHCNDPIDDDHETFCGMCREMGCTLPSTEHK